MAKSTCVISVESKQRMGTETDSYNEKYFGSYIDRGDNKYLSYERIHEETKTTSLINFSNKGMTLTQSGDVTSKFEFKPLEKTSVEYKTPMGTLMGDVYTKSYYVKRIKNQIEIGLLYEFTFVGSETIETEMKIKASIND